MKRVLFTRDDDLLAEASQRQREGRPFFGVTYAHQLYVPIGICIRNLEIIAIACDLTDRSGKQRKRKTGWEHWETHKEKWRRKWLIPTGRHVEFVPWTASD